MAWLTSTAYHGMPDGSYVGTSPKRNVDVAALVYCKPETVLYFMLDLLWYFIMCQGSIFIFGQLQLVKSHPFTKLTSTS